MSKAALNRSYFFQANDWLVIERAFIVLNAFLVELIKNVAHIIKILFLIEHARQLWILIIFRNRSCRLLLQTRFDPSMELLIKLIILMCFDYFSSAHVELCAFMTDISRLGDIYLILKIHEASVVTLSIIVQCLAHLFRTDLF